MHTTSVKTISLILLAAVVVSLFPLASARAAIVEPGFESEVIASGLVLPTTVAFAEDGRIFIAEKGGTVRVVKNGVLLPTPVIVLTDVNTFGDRGLLGIATDPNFLTNGYLYLSYSYENTPGANIGGEKTGRIVRVTVVNDIAEESSKVVLVGTVGGSAAAPSCDDVAVTADCIPSDSPSHSVGGLRFGPDGKLYATTGDGAHFDYADPRSLRAQNLDSLAGKVLRINTDGTAPSDNPFFTGDVNANRSKVYALGVRNSFKFNFEPLFGGLFGGDVGWSLWEEVNLIVSGANFGWPCIEGNATTSHNCAPSSTPTAPLYTYAHDASGAGSITAGAFPDSNAYPAAYNLSMFFGDYAQNWIKRLVLDSSYNVVDVVMFDDSPDGPVEIVTGPDGHIYYLAIYTGELRRITHTTGNRRPVVEVSALPTSGLTPLSVAFSSAGSYDPDGNSFTYLWNFGDGAISTDPNPSHVYSNTGTYNASLTLTDEFGSIAAKSINITAGNQAPAASITSPASGSLYVTGQMLTVTGLGTDLEDGSLSASQHSWKIILHHNTHIHIIQEFTGISSITFEAPDHNASDVYVEVELTVTDSVGLTDTTSINMYLNNGGSAGNLIANPSLEVANETSGQPLSWHTGWYGAMNPIFTYPVPGLDGTKAAKVEITSYTEGDAKWYFDPVFVTPGQNYTFKNTYTATVPTVLTVQYGLSNGTYMYGSLASLPAAATPIHNEYTFTVPAGAQTAAVFHELEMVGELVIDNYSLALAVPPDTEVPTVSITSPLTGTEVSGSILVDVLATDNIGVTEVHLVVDGLEVGSADTTAPYSFSLNTSTLADGTHTLSAHAHDAAGNQGSAALVTIVVDNTPNLLPNPDLEIEEGSEPLSWNKNSWGNHTAVFTYPVVGHNGQKAARVEITSYPPAGTGDAKWFFEKLPVVPGTQYSYTDYYRSNTISDIIGQYTLDTGGFHYFGLHKEIPPSLTWSTAGGTFTPPSNATHVTFFHLISAQGFVEIDDADFSEVGTSTPSETNAPLVEFTNPLEGQTVSGTVGITASSTDDTAVTYIFYAVDGIPVTGQITSAPYLFNWDTTTVSDGPHTLKATTHDPFGNNSTHTITVTVDNTSVPPPSNNLILNPSLETPGTGGNPLHWLRGGWGDNVRTYHYPVAGIHGTSAAKVEITSYSNGDAKWFFEDVPVTPGTTYQYSEQFRTNVPTEMLARYTLSGGGVQYAFIQALPASPSWSTFAIDIVPPANAVSFTMFHILHSTGELEIDNFSFVDPIASGDTVAPTVSIASPSLGETVSGTTTISVNANDNVAVVGVEMLVDNVLAFSEDLSSPYSFVWDTATLADGVYALTARARDAAGNIATSTIVGVTVDNTSVPPPSNNLILNPSLETPGTGGNPLHWLRGGWGTNTRTYQYPVSGIDGADAARVEITGHVNGDAKWFFEDVPVTSGIAYTFTHSFRSSVSTEVLARYTMSGGGFQYQFLGSKPAVVSWTSSAYTITPPAGATSLTVFHVIYSDGFLEVDNFSLVDPTPVPDTTAPIVTLASPSTGATVSGVSTVTVNASDNIGVVAVEFLVNNVPVPPEDALAPYAFLWDTMPLSNGTYILNARARDAAGNVATSTSVSVTVNNVPTSSNLIQNPSFEMSDGSGEPTHWFKGGWGTNNRQFTYPVVGFAGASAARVDISGYVNGDAKWRFEDVTVTPGATYTMTHAYRSDTTTNITVRYTLSNGSFQYVSLGNRGASTSWQTINHTFVVPATAVSMSVMHILHSNGYLEVDDFTLIPGNSNAFSQGMVSFTFDDGWLSHYTAALPILDTANIDGTFYIVSLETMNAAPQERILNAGLEIAGAGNNPENWFRGGWGTNDRLFTYPVTGNGGGAGVSVQITSYTDGDAKWFFQDVPVTPGEDYIVKLDYKSNIPSTLIARYTKTDGTFVYAGIQNLSSTGDSWISLVDSIVAPADVLSVTLFHVISEVGYLATDNYSLKTIQDYLDPAQMLAIQASGHEIGGHSRTHASMTGIPLAEAEIEIEGSRNEILSMGGLLVEAFCYPFGDYNLAVQTLTQGAGYTSARSVDRGFNTKATDKFALKIQSVNRDTTMADIEGWVNQAVTDKTWLILMFHQIDYDLTQTLGVTPEFLTDIVNYTNSTPIVPVTVGEGVSLMNP